ncbi:MAG: peptidoglycan-binding domain-containing protein, partial [Minisyncoccia bacterium]
MSKKLIAIALAGIFALSIVAPVKADTNSDYQAEIQALNAQIAALEAKLGQQSQSTGMVCFNTNLKLGMKSDNVKNLQIKLGVTPASGYFGPITLAAVKAFQSSNGIITTGYVGPLTRAALNAKYCVPPTTVPQTTTTTVAPSYGTLSVQDYPVSNPQSTWYGGQTYEALDAQYKATG